MKRGNCDGLNPRRCDRQWRAYRPALMEHSPLLRAMHVRERIALRARLTLIDDRTCSLA